MMFSQLGIRKLATKEEVINEDAKQGSDVKIQRP